MASIITEKDVLMAIDMLFYSDGKSILKIPLVFLSLGFCLGFESFHSAVQ